MPKGFRTAARKLVQNARHQRLEVRQLRQRERHTGFQCIEDLAFPSASRSNCIASCAARAFNSARLTSLARCIARRRSGLPVSAPVMIWAWAASRATRLAGRTRPCSLGTQSRSSLVLGAERIAPQRVRIKEMPPYWAYWGNYYTGY